MQQDQRWVLDIVTAEHYPLVQATKPPKARLIEPGRCVYSRLISQPQLSPAKYGDYPCRISGRNQSRVTP
jgi:hypothetical protein